MPALDSLVKDHKFFEGLASKHIDFIAGCARNLSFDSGTYVLREGQPADEFYLISRGKVALEIAAGGKRPIIFATLLDGEIVGASWLVAPYRWAFDARAVSPTEVLGIDAVCLRNKCETDHDFGYEIMKRFLPVFLARLQATRFQILDVYGRS